jgi:hypothetical protein
MAWHGMAWQGPHPEAPGAEQTIRRPTRRGHGTEDYARCHTNFAAPYSEDSGRWCYSRNARLFLLASSRLPLRAQPARKRKCLLLSPPKHSSLHFPQYMNVWKSCSSNLFFTAVTEQFSGTTSHFHSFETTAGKPEREIRWQAYVF